MDVEKNFTQEKNITADGEVFRLLFDDHPIPMIIYDMETLALLRVNNAAVGRYGYSREEFAKMGLGDILPEEETARLLDAMAHRSPALKNLGEWKNLLKDGTLIVVEVSSHSLKFEGRKSVLVMVQDITARKKSEEALREAEANYRSIFENATVGIYQSTPQGHFVAVNPAMARIFGYDSPAEMLETVCNIDTQYYVEPADRREFQRIIHEKGEVREFCCWNYRKDGSRAWVQENAREVKDAQGGIRYYEGFITDITEQKLAEDGLHRAKESLEHANRELETVLAREQQLARTDGLTGLYNYRYFFEVASHEFNTALRYHHSISILMFDADGFKQINDTYGHLVGDAMLAKMAETVTKQMRASDVLARYGGDEFVTLLSHTNARQAFSIAERIRQSVEAQRLTMGREQLSVTLSIGVADLSWEPRDDGVERIVQRADKALYAAKQAGRNRAVIFDETMR